MGDSQLKRDFFAGGAPDVARALIGCELHVRCAAGECSGRIVEAEAYLGEEDPASHAGRGPTPRSRIMFGPAGVVYVYLIYGMHHCLNLVTGPEGSAGAVLIRALEPRTGRELMARRRGLDPTAAGDRELTAGPGRLCRACGIDLDWNGLPVGSQAGVRASAADALWLLRGDSARTRVIATPRIGISQAMDLPYRFIDPESPGLSR